jgi:hypothetical protein
MASKKTKERGATMASTSTKLKKTTCTPFSVQIAVLTPDDKHEIHFGISKGCNPDDSAFWTIDFLLKEDKAGTMKTRVEVHVVVGKNQQDKAQSLADAKELTPQKLALLEGRVADRAQELPSGTTQDPQLSKMLLKVL